LQTSFLVPIAKQQKDNIESVAVENYNLGKKKNRSGCRHGCEAIYAYAQIKFVDELKCFFDVPVRRSFSAPRNLASLIQIGVEGFLHRCDGLKPEI